jgi:tRNA G10  N-methylase Trm11
MKHPAVFSDAVLARIAPIIAGRSNILDPFAGVGKLTEVLSPDQEFVGFEIEEEWASQNPRVTCIDAFQGMKLYNQFFDAVVTSPPYGNRMADHHEAKDGSHRRTYRHYLGRPLHPANSGRLQWGGKYRAFHVLAWREAWRCVSRGGIFVLNVKNHIRNGKEQWVTEWHASVLSSMPRSLLKCWITVPVHGYRYGDNRVRIPYESILVFEKLSCTP